MSQQTRTAQREQQQHGYGGRWLNLATKTMEVQVQLYRTGFQLWRRAITSPTAVFGRFSPGVPRAATEAATAEVERMATIAPIADSSGTSLESLTVEHLDRIAAANGVEDYPQSGTKSEKIAALSGAELTLEALTVEHLDRIADAGDIEDYPRAGTKSEKIAALEAAAVTLTEQS